MSADLHLVELVTRQLPASAVAGANPAELVEAIRIDHGPRIELPEGSRVAVEYQAGASTPKVTVTIMAGQVRHVDTGEAKGPDLPLVNDVVIDPDGTRNVAHPYESLGENGSDGFCRRCGRDSRDALHSETPGWPWPSPGDR